MKKTILFLWPYKFTEFDYYKHELYYFEKKLNYKVIINDLSEIVTNKTLNSTWHARLEKRSKKFSSLASWIKFINKLDKKNLFIFNHLSSDNFVSFFINFFIKSLNIPILIIRGDDVATVQHKKNPKWVFSKIKENFFNLRRLYFAFGSFFFNFLNIIKKSKNKIILRIGSDKKKKNKQGFYLDCHSQDYSNHLLNGFQNRKKKIYKFNYIIYLDTGFPHNPGDAQLNYADLPPKEIVHGFYTDLNSFFNNLEDLFNAKVILLPHPRNKLPHLKKNRLNPYFEKRIINNDYDGAMQLIPNCKFVVSRGSTALSYAIINYKPNVLVYSSKLAPKWENFEDIFYLAKLLNIKSFVNICSYNIDDISRNLYVEKLKYDAYKYKYLTTKGKSKAKIPNYKIIGDFLNKHF